MAHDDYPHDVLLDLKAVCEILSRSKASIYRDIKAKRFPKQVKLGGSSRWRRSEVLAKVGLTD